MLQGHKFACVLAAREGSKRLKNKNVCKCAGKPLWQWTKEAVEGAGIFTYKIVTTDLFGLAVPFSKSGCWTWEPRPSRLAKDDTRISDVMEWVINKGYLTQIEYVCLVSPTNPLRTGKHIRAAAQLMLKEKADAVVAVAPCHPIYQNILLRDDKQLFIYHPSGIDKMTHLDKKKSYHLTGSIVIAKTELWQRKASIYNDPSIKTVGYVMPKWDIDIDGKEDLFMAEATLEWLKKRRISLKSCMESVLRARRSRKSQE